MPSVAFMALGCKVNQVETESLEGLFWQAGFDIVPFDSPADAYVINTCSVTSFGDKKSRQIIRRAHRQNERAVVAVCGCYAQVAPEEIEKIEGVRVVLGTRERHRIVDYVEQALREDGTAAGVAKPVLEDIDNALESRVFEDIPLYDMPQRTRAFLKIEDGCENFCSYCIIPYARGPVKSRPLDSIKAEAQKLVDAGYWEIVLTGIHLGAYGRDFVRDGVPEKGRSLADACRAVLSVPGLRRLRLGSLESLELSPELFELIRSDDRFCAHLHLPLQAGSDAVLKAMNRHYDTAEFARLIETVEREVPGVAVSTDIIVGFPGETEEMFQQSLAFAERMNFARMHVFPYSRRPGTPAAARPDQVPEPVKKNRVHRMQAMAQRKADEFHRAFIGRTLRVLFETCEDGITDGLTDNYIRVYTDAPVQTGEIYEMHLERTYRDGLWGEPVSPEDGADS